MTLLIIFKIIMKLKINFKRLYGKDIIPINDFNTGKILYDI